MTCKKTRWHNLAQAALQDGLRASSSKPHPLAILLYFTLKGWLMHFLTLHLLL
jgi:hypothetical protein